MWRRRNTDCSPTPDARDRWRQRRSQYRRTRSVGDRQTQLRIGSSILCPHGTRIGPKRSTDPDEGEPAVVELEVSGGKRADDQVTEQHVEQRLLVGQRDDCSPDGVCAVADGIASRRRLVSRSAVSFASGVGCRCGLGAGSSAGGRRPSIAESPSMSSNPARSAASAAWCASERAARCRCQAVEFRARRSSSVMSSAFTSSRGTDSDERPLGRRGGSSRRRDLGPVGSDRDETKVPVVS